MRAPAKRELNAYRRWVQRRTGVATHFSTGDEVLLSRLTAGGPSVGDAAAALEQVVAAMPGLDTRVRARRLGLGWVAWLLLVVGLGSFGVLGGVLGRWLLAQAAGLAGSAWFFAAVRGVWFTRTPVGVFRSRVRGLRFPVARSVARRGPAGGDQSGRGVRDPYPLADDALLLAPAMVAGLASPSAGAASGAAVTSGRPAPPALKEPVGVVLGTDCDGSPVHLDASALGVSMLGLPGRGKSFALRVCMAWAMTERVCPSGLPGRPGRDNTLVMFEVKPSAVDADREWAEFLGDDLVVVEVADSSTPAIDLFGAPGTPRQKSIQFVEGMRYAFGEGTIENASIETLNQVLPAAMWLSEHDTEHTPRRSVMGYAHRLLGGTGDEVAVNLARQVESSREPVAADCWETLSVLFGGAMTAAARRQKCEAPRNKLAQLSDLESWWAPDRVRVSWDELLTSHDAVVISAASPKSVGAGMQPVSDRQKQIMSSLLMFMLKEAIERLCSTWEDENRFVSVFSDELSLLAGSSPEVVTWMRDQGRSYGVRPFFATQYPHQVSEMVRKSVLGFESVLWFAQNDPGVLAMAVSDLGLGSESWTETDVAGIPNYQVALRASVRGARQEPCVVRVGSWENDKGSWWSAQGYSPPDAARVTDRPWMRRDRVPVESDVEVPVEASAGAPGERFVGDDW